MWSLLLLLFIFKPQQPASLPAGRAHALRINSTLAASRPFLPHVVPVTEEMFYMVTGTLGWGGGGTYCPSYCYYDLVSHIARHQSAYTRVRQKPDFSPSAAAIEFENSSTFTIISKFDLLTVIQTFFCKPKEAFRSCDV
ncbi:hypothetical protein F2P81_016652 [Scophthalmus maximus]|uniref:Uncharacterized protein n=1 Tax=Scophthalmus maximus TaxID=52904 RepID=A0A6A4SFR8_SCOMX|nr:hypothetical protein F2P81_016652 [Scophthalmus maximus]